MSETPVLIAIDRGLRPSDLAKKGDAPAGPKKCVFCPGFEGLTPQPELLRFKAEGDPNMWDLRVVNNKFPATGPTGPASHTRFLVEPMNSTVLNAYGAHEVIIETHQHHDTLLSMSTRGIVNLFRAIVDRERCLYQDKRIAFVQVFKNHGKESGASLEHPHTQIIALQLIPERLMRRLAQALEYKQRHGHSVFQKALETAEEHKLHIDESPNCAAYAPYDSKFPFELTILPLAPESRLEQAAHYFEELAIFLQRVFRRLEAVLNEVPDFNLLLEQAPPNVYADADSFFRWRLRVLPRLSKIGGFELGTGYYINPLPPENAAAALRACAV